MQSDKGFLGEFGSAVVQIADEKGIDRAKVLGVVEAAIAAAYKKEYGKRGQNIRAEFDEAGGDAQFFLMKEVVDDSTRDFTVVEEFDDKKRFSKTPAGHSDGEERLPRFNEERDIILKDAKKEKKDAVIGDVIEFSLPSKTDFGRVAAQTAKQVVIQRVREAERDSMFEEYKGREHEVVGAVVQRVEGRTVFVDLGKATAVLFPSEQVRTERYMTGMRLKVYIIGVSQDPKGPGITVSRTHPELVRRLFELEVPEIFTGTVEIKAIAREAGSRAKIAVFTDEDGVDPIGSCVGQRGTRVQTIIDELGGEKMDIIEWEDDAARFIAAALSPAKVINVVLDEEKKEAVATVPDDQLSLAIGKRGQNVRLAVKLTGWNIDVVGATAETAVDENTTQSDDATPTKKGDAEEGEAVDVKTDTKEEEAVSIKEIPEKEEDKLQDTKEEPIANESTAEGDSEDLKASKKGEKKQK